MENRRKKPVTIIIRRNFQGTKTAAEVLEPILVEELKRLAGDTLDKSEDSEYTVRTA